MKQILFLIVAIISLEIIASCSKEENEEISMCNEFAEPPVFRFSIKNNPNIEPKDFELYYEVTKDDIREFSDHFIKNNTFEIQLEYATKFILSNLNNANEYSIEHSALEKETTRCGVIYSHRITINNELICNDCDLNNIYHVY